MNSTTGKPRGVLNQKAGEQKFQLHLHLPSPDLAFFIEHFWIVRWDLRGEAPYRQEVLPHPSVHLVFDKGQTRLFGVMTGKFAYLLQDKGQVLGIKFRPGAFYPFVKSPVSRYTDREIRLEEVFEVDGGVLEEVILSQQNDAAMVRLAEDFLRARLPEQDEQVALINRIIETIIAAREITQVDELVERVNLSKRTLQRLFSQYVGVSPKWVIKRYRLHEAAEQVAQGTVENWPELALTLGYFDQAHFIKDFKRMVGRTPAEYARRLG